MIKFLFKGIWRDASRSRLPIIIVSIGVFLTIVMSAFVTGVMGDMVDTNARFTTGHVKVMTRAYAENSDQLPNDLALMGVDSVEDALKANYPNIQWVQRIRFGGLMDVPDEQGETRAQGPVSGLAVELFNKDSGEQERLNIGESLRSGNVPTQPGEVLISDELANKLDIKIGDEITLFGTTMYGSMTFKNFTVAGTLAFGSTALDRGGIIVDIQDAREALDMEDATGELLGYFDDGQYDDERAQQVAQRFNQQYEGSEDEFAPVMLRLKEQNQLASMIDYADNMTGILVGIFIFCHVDCSVEYRPARRAAPLQRVRGAASVGRAQRSHLPYPHLRISLDRDHWFGGGYRRRIGSSVLFARKRTGFQWIDAVGIHDDAHRLPRSYHPVHVLHRFYSRLILDGVRPGTFRNWSVQTRYRPIVQRARGITDTE